MKKCSKCLKTKELTGFPRFKRSKDGYHGQCRDCRNSYARSLAGKESKRKYRKSAKGKTAERKYKTSVKVKARNKHKSTELINVIKITYKAMKSRVEGKTHNSYLYEGLPIIDKDTFVEWALHDTNLRSIYAAWDKETFKHRPCVDRIDPNIGYVLGNMQWLTVSENSKKARGSFRVDPID